MRSGVAPRRALVALALLPGLLVVRAPWTAVPALSLAFWALAAWWPPLAGPGRSRVARGIAARLRSSWRSLRLLPKHEVPPPPGWAAPGRPAGAPAPGPARARRSRACAVARSSSPRRSRSSPPAPALAPRARARASRSRRRRRACWSGATASRRPRSRCCRSRPSAPTRPALATLAADVSHLSGLDPARPLLARRGRRRGPAARRPLRPPRHVGAPARRGARRARWALAAAPWPGFLSLWGEGEALLALALRAARGGAAARPRLAVLGRGRGDAARGGALAQPLLAAARRPRGRGGRAPPARGSAAAGGWRSASRWSSPHPASGRSLGRCRCARRCGRRSAPVARGCCRSPLGLLLAALAPLALAALAERRPRPARRHRRGRGAGRGAAARRAGPRLDRLGPAAPRRRATALAARPRPRRSARAVCAPRGRPRLRARARRPRAAGEPGPWIPRSTRTSGHARAAGPARRGSRLRARRARDNALTRPRAKPPDAPSVLRGRTGERDAADVVTARPGRSNAPREARKRGRRVGRHAPPLFLRRSDYHGPFPPGGGRGRMRKRSG